MDLDDDGLVNESERLLSRMPGDTKFLIEQLQKKHGLEEIPDIDESTNGGYEVKVHGGDGFYYFYIITPENEVVHLATTGKSKMSTLQNKRLGPTLDELNKSGWGQPNDFHVFKSAGSGQANMKDEIITGNRDSMLDWRMSGAEPVVIVPDIASYDDSTDNGLTSRMKEAIGVKMQELKGRVYSVTNNQDTTYTVIFETEGGAQKGFIVDRDGNLESLSSLLS